MSEAGSSPTRIVASPSSPRFAPSSLTSARTRSASALPSITVATGRDVSLSCVNTEQLAPEQNEDRSAYAGVLRYYELAKRAEWQGGGKARGGGPAIPAHTGRPPKLAGRPHPWRSAI